MKLGSSKGKMGCEMDSEQEISGLEEGKKCSFILAKTSNIESNNVFFYQCSYQSKTWQLGIPGR